MTVEPTLEGDDDLLLAIQRIGRLMGSRQVSSRIAGAAGAEGTKQGVQILRSLHRFGEQPIAGLASLAHMDIAAVSRQLRLLEEASPRKKTADAPRARAAPALLTP